MEKKRYCSIECRQRLKYQLELRTGLLKALNTRYATFYFTSSEIILDILVSDSMEIKSFIFRRMPGKKPVDDFIRMSNQLGNEWWTVKRRTTKRYLANQVVLNRAEKGEKTWSSPREMYAPVYVNSSLNCLKLSKSLLQSSDAVGYIKTAFRKMAKAHHPDQGGDSAKFIKIHEAYQRLLEWSKCPVYSKRRGFVDKWFYDGSRNKWIQPLPSG